MSSHLLPVWTAQH
eukprot:Gb_07346 [translate_table: standard]